MPRRRESRTAAGPVTGRTARGWRLRRHPSDVELGAWFDRADHEALEAVPQHLASCLRCSRKVQDWRRVRAALRDEPLPPVAARRRVAWGWSMAPLAAGVALAVLVFGPAPLSEPLTAAWRQEEPRSVGGDTGQRESGGGSPLPAVPIPTTSPGSTPAPDPARSSGPAPHGSEVRSGPPPGGAAGPVGAGPGRSKPGSPPSSATELPVEVALRLGTVTGTEDIAADEAAEITAALERAVGLANEAGGVGGRPVELRVAQSDDPAGVARMLRSVDVLVGGGGIVPPAGLNWLFPADPSVDGDHVVRAEWPTAEVGRLLAEDLDAREIRGVVGAVIGEGPEAALADGFARHRSVVRASVGKGDDCAEAIGALRRRAVVAVVVAGGPGLVQSCAEAAATTLWRPPGGLLVAPAAAYAHTERAPELQGARTVLGMPWPTSDAPGANRYRAAVPEGRSYRALVSFAAVELAVQIARAGGSFDDAGIRSTDWRSDLFDVRHGRQASPFLVVATLGSWWPQSVVRPRDQGSGEPVVR